MAKRPGINKRAVAAIQTAETEKLSVISISCQGPQAPVVTGVRLREPASN